MPDALAAALDHPGLGWLMMAALLAGSVRGFVGFGTAMVFIPIAAQILDPFEVLMAIVIMDAFGPVPNLPGAWRLADKPDLARLMVGTAIGLPFGLWTLSQVSPDLFQIAVGAVALSMVVCLALGFRFRGRVGPGLVFATGGAAGLLGGTTGLAGPPVILLYMASSHPAKVVRASTMVYLFAVDLVLGGMLYLGDLVALGPVLIGCVLAVPNLAGNLLGGWMFRPDRERLYRAVAYTIVAASAVSALWIWE
ncbi:MAG: sulfite exporter TauE/SafE family protein [Pseudomonadota bacterium]